MADIAAIRAALAANIGAIPDLQVSPYILANPTPPSAQVVPAAMEFDLAMHRGLDRLEFKVQVFAGVVSDIGAQKKLDLYRAGSGANSIKQAIESDKTLGGACQALQVTESTGPQLTIGEGGTVVLMEEFTVQVLATGA